jgi:hypothetical protein
MVPVACIGARHVKHVGTTEGGETVGGSSCGGELSTCGGSTEMISDGRSDADRKMLINCIGENLLPSAQAWKLRRPGPPVAAPGTGNSHADLLCYLIPGQASVTQLPDPLCGGRMSGRTARTHLYAGALELLADCAPMNAQLGSDLTRSPTLGVHISCTLNVHGNTVTSLSRSASDRIKIFGARVTNWRLRRLLLVLLLLVLLLPLSGPQGHEGRPEQTAHRAPGIYTNGSGDTISAGERVTITSACGDAQAPHESRSLATIRRT